MPSPDNTTSRRSRTPVRLTSSWVSGRCTPRLSLTALGFGRGRCRVGQRPPGIRITGHEGNHLGGRLCRFAGCCGLFQRGRRRRLTA